MKIQHTLKYARTNCSAFADSMLLPGWLGWQTDRLNIPVCKDLKVVAGSIPSRDAQNCQQKDCVCMIVVPPDFAYSKCCPCQGDMQSHICHRLQHKNKILSAFDLVTARKQCRIDYAAGLCLMHQFKLWWWTCTLPEHINNSCRTVQPSKRPKQICAVDCKTVQLGSSAMCNAQTAYLCLRRELLDKFGHTTLGVCSGVVKQGVISSLLYPWAGQHKDLHCTNCGHKSIVKSACCLRYADTYCMPHPAHSLSICA